MARATMKNRELMIDAYMTFMTGAITGRSHVAFDDDGDGVVLPSDEVADDAHDIAIHALKKMNDQFKLGMPIVTIRKKRAKHGSDEEE